MNYSGRTVKIRTLSPLFGYNAGGEQNFRVEGLWKDIMGKNPVESADSGNPAALTFMIRAFKDGVPMAGNVYYGKTDNGLGHLVHESEIVSS